MRRGTAPQLDSGVLHLLRKCPVGVGDAPVSRPQASDPASVDPDSSDPVRDGLNNLVLRLATSLANREGGELHVGHAWSLEFESTLRLSPFLKLPRAEVDAMVREAEADHREQLEAMGYTPSRSRNGGLNPHGVWRPARGVASLGTSARHRSS